MANDADNAASAEQDDTFIKPSEAARLLNRSDRWIRRELEAGRLVGQRSATGRWRVSARSVEERKTRDSYLESPATVKEFRDALIETSIELGREQARRQMAEERAARLEARLRQLGFSGEDSDKSP
jgi:hypothetical protein